MKTAIYQYWIGNIPSGSYASQENIKKYADYVGADYIFKHNDNYTKKSGVPSEYYDAFRPIYDDQFLDYDRVLFLDMDIFALNDITENIFEESINDIGICEETLQPELRSKSTVGSGINLRNDRKWGDLLEKTWGASIPLDAQNRPKVFNSGVVMYTNKGLQKARKNFVSFDTYINKVRQSKLNRFYCLDQNYLHAMIFSVDIDHTVMNSKWNTQIHYVGNPKQVPRPVNDMRTNETNFVHIQLRGADQFSKDKLWRVTNLDQSEWKLNQK